MGVENVYNWLYLYNSFRVAKKLQIYNNFECTVVILLYIFFAYYCSYNFKTKSKTIVQAIHGNN